jgi:hypothetical protein
MKTMRFLVGLVFSLLACGGVQAAYIDSLRLNPNALFYLPANGVISVADTGVGNRVNDALWLYNLSDSAFSDTINLYYKINGTVYTTYSNGQTSGMDFTPISVNIPAHDSANIGNAVFYFQDTLRFKAGPNAVVIWPGVSHTSIFVLDSAKAIINLHNSAADLSGINQFPDEKSRVYMQRQQLIIKSNDENPVKSIKIYNAFGSLMFNVEVEENNFIPMDHYAAGIYFAEIIYKDNLEEVVKVLNMP